MLVMSDQIQCKRSLNQGLTDKLKIWNTMEGGKNEPAQSFPNPLLRRNMQLAKCFLNVNFSLGQDNHDILIQCNGRLNLKTER